MSIKQLVKSHNDFGFSILKQLVRNKDKVSNLVFSPLSIYSMISLIASGKSKGKSLDDLLSFLKFNSVNQLNSCISKLGGIIFKDESSSGGPCVTSANGIWIQDYLPVRPSFRMLFENIYKGRLNQVDFINKRDQIVKEVNSWAEKETRGLIKTLISCGQIDSTTRLILGNAIYFKAAWNSPFNAISTREFDFHLVNGNSIRFPFMCSHEDRAISVFDGFKVALLPYKCGNLYDQNDNRSDFSMCLFLPDARDGLPSLIERICSEPGFLDRHCPSEKVQVGEFRIPKVKFSYDFEATGVLKEIGLDSVFAGDLSEMVEFPAAKELSGSDMFHKAVIDIDEEYTEAAAVTLCFRGCSGPWEKVVKIDFVADHPFLFVITENMTGTVLFIGQLLHPSS